MQQFLRSSGNLIKLSRNLMRFKFSIKNQIKGEKDDLASDNSILNDLFDYEGNLDQFQKSNQQVKESKLNSSVDDMEVLNNLKELLGKNFERYANTVYKISSQDNRQRYDRCIEYNAASKYNSQLRYGARVFKNQEQLRRMRFLESRGWGGLSQYPESVNYPVKSLSDLYKPQEIVQQLNINELAIFNIPLKCDEDGMRGFLMNEIGLVGGQVVDVKLVWCKLNMNSYAVVRLGGDLNLHEVVQKIRQARYDGCVLDVCTVEDAVNQNAWDRTIVLLNLDPQWGYQDIMHWASQYGRVHNGLIPMMQSNPDLPTEEELIKALEKDATQKYPVKLIVYDIEKNRIERRFWPSEIEFMDFHKRHNVYDESQGDIEEFQSTALNEEIKQRLFFLQSEREYSCLRVPGHLRERLSKLWIPDLGGEKVKQSEIDQQLERLFSKNQVNLGYALITYSSKLLAQRALYNITARASNDLSFLQIPLHNQPVFQNQTPEPHTNQKRYGTKFNTNSLILGELDETPTAIKAWQGMELYHIDACYIINQMERMRKEAADTVDSVRHSVNQENVTPVDNQEILDKKEELRQRIFRELSEPENSKEFDRMIARNQFSKLPDQFQENFTYTIGNDKKAGRQFNIDITQEDYTKQINELIGLAGRQQSTKEDYVADIVNKNQKENILKHKLDSRVTVPPIASDPIYRQYQSRLIQKYKRQQNKSNQIMNNIEQGLERSNKLIDEDDDKVEQLDKKYFEIGERKRALNERKKEKAKALETKPDTGFSTHRRGIENTNLIEKHSIKQDQFLQELKQLMFGTYSNEVREQIFSIGNDLFDFHDYSQRFSEDVSGQIYLSDGVIEEVRNFDLPEDEEQRLQIRRQEFNRKFLVAQIPQEALPKLRQELQESLTDSILQQNAIGTPTESFEIYEGQDGKKIESELNQYVAGRGETYHLETDEQTKKEYIIKSEKPFYKYDLEVISNMDLDDNIQKFIAILMEEKQLTEERARQIIQRTLDSGEIDPLLKDLYQQSLQEVHEEDIDIEQAMKELKIQKKELDLHLTTNIFEEQELFQDEIQQQMNMESLRMKYAQIDKDTVLKKDEPNIKLKTPSGKYKVPKFRNL